MKADGEDLKARYLFIDGEAERHMGLLAHNLRFILCERLEPDGPGRDARPYTNVVNACEAGKNSRLAFVVPLPFGWKEHVYAPGLWPAYCPDHLSERNPPHPCLLEGMAPVDLRDGHYGAAAAWVLEHAGRGVSLLRRKFYTHAVHRFGVTCVSNESHAAGQRMAERLAAGMLGVKL